jgi:hypothetical protein
MSAQTTNKAMFSPSFVESHGALWFDEIEDKPYRKPYKGNVSGYYSIAGNKSVRFHNLSDLPKNIFWTSNLTKAEVWSLGQWNWIKHRDAFGIPWSSSWPASGAVMNEEGLSAFAAAEAERHCRLAFWFSSQFQKQQKSPFRWDDDDLASILRRRWSEEKFEDQPLDSSSPFAFILKHAYLESVKVQRLWSGVTNNVAAAKGSRLVTLGVNPRESVRHLWTQRIPKGKWQPCNEHQWPKSQEARLQWAQEQGKPLLLLVQHRSWKDDVEAVWPGEWWWGQRGGHFGSMIPDPVWVRGEDLSTITQYCTVDLLEAWIGEQWQTLPQWEETGLVLPDPFASWSPTMQWVARLSWEAVSGKRHHRSKNEAPVTPSMLWLRQEELNALWAIAHRLGKKGWSVVEYGNGSMTFMIPNDVDLRQFALDAWKEGLILPPVLARLLNPDDVLIEGASDKFAYWWFQYHGGRAVLKDMDRIMLPWPADMASLKARMMTSARRLQGLSTMGITVWDERWKSLLTSQARISVDRLQQKS